MKSSPPSESSPGFHTVTLGCKLNQFDSAAIEGELLRRGYACVAEPALAQVVVINTCTVTHRADSDARQLIRSMRRASPDCTLLVTGCYAEREREALAGMREVSAVFGNREKAALSTILDKIGIARTPQERTVDRGCENVTNLPQALHFGERSRAFLKIQEGCRLACSYCIIPAVRGPSRSVAPTEVEKGMQSLIDAGYREIVLTGVNTGDYGRDLDPRSNLATLLRSLLARCGKTRLRLNSLEPLTVTDEIVALIANDARLASHLQIPLQSGSTEILKSMRRNYRKDAYVTLLRRLRREIPDIGLGADVIVGFPGETEVRFQETFDLVAASELNYLHVFSWSPRPGTPAADYSGQVEPRVRKERSLRLRTLGLELSLRFRRRFEGRLLEAIALTQRKDAPFQRALTDNFIEVELPPDSIAAGRPVTVRIGRSDAGRTVALPERTPTWA